jgi:hypothetical protein
VELFGLRLCAFLLRGIAEIIPRNVRIANSYSERNALLITQTKNLEQNGVVTGPMRNIFVLLRLVRILNFLLFELGTFEVSTVTEDENRIDTVNPLYEIPNVFHKYIFSGYIGLSPFL